MKLFCSKNFYESHLGNILIGSLWFYLISSILNKFIEYFCDYIFFHSISSFIKIIFLFFLFLILLFNFKEKKNLFIYLGAIFVVFILANLRLVLNINTFYSFFKCLEGSNVFYFVKYLYPFFFLGAFSLANNKKEITSYYFEILEKILLINAFFVFLGFLFSINYFQSYINSNRFGYDGVLERSFFGYLSIIVIARKTFLNKIDLSFLILCMAALLSGTKLIILFFMFLVIFYLYENRKIRILYLISIILILGMVFYKPIINFTIKLFPFWKSILNRYGYITVLLSERDLSFHNTFEYLKINGTLSHLFIGGMEFPKYWVEMDFIDLFLFFGIIGVAIYILLLSKIINKLFHLIPLGVSFFAGGFLLSTTIMSIYFLWIYESHTELKRTFKKEIDL